MTKTKTKRKTSARRPAPARRKAVKKTPLLNRILARLPFSDAQLQKAATVGVLGVFAAIAITVAQFMGLPAMVGHEMALAAGRAGFEVKKVEVRNVDKMNELAVYEIVLAQKDRSMPLVDLNQVREDLIAFGWIADARVSRQLPDTLIVDIVEREPRAVWDNGKQIVLIDEHGVALEAVKSAKETGLLRIVGPKANHKVEALFALLDEAPALTPLVSEAEWIGNRRWNLSFTSGEVLALPEGEETSAAALVNFARMDGVNRLLGKGVTYFDLRDPDRAYLRKPKVKPKPEAVEQPEAPKPAQTDNGDTANKGRDAAAEA